MHEFAWIVEFQYHLNGLNSPEASIIWNCLFDPFLLKYIHFYTYFVKKRDSHKIFRLRMKILWEPGFQVPCHYPTMDCLCLVKGGITLKDVLVQASENSWDLGWFGFSFFGISCLLICWPSISYKWKLLAYQNTIYTICNQYVLANVSTQKNHNWYRYLLTRMTCCNRFHNVH